MGGMNHQPCRAYLLNSTLLSKYLSLARAHLDLSNAALEDILIQELSPSPVDAVVAMSHYDRLNAEMMASIEALGLSRQTLADLRQQMDDLGFADLPTLKKLDLSSIGSSLAASGIVSLTAWEHIQNLMSSGGFYEVVSFFDACIDDLISRSHDLLDNKFGGHMTQLVIEGGVAEMVEENASGTFKIEFAALYSKWTEFNGLFLASSMMSTELWFAFAGKGSLMPGIWKFKAA